MTTASERIDDNNSMGINPLFSGSGGSPFQISLVEDVLSIEKKIVITKGTKAWAAVEKFENNCLYFTVQYINADSGNQISICNQGTNLFKFALVDSPDGQKVHPGTEFFAYVKKEEKIIINRKPLPERKCPGTPLPERRLALIIGNSKYKINPLGNPLNDARDMAEHFKQLGFDTMYRENVDIFGLLDALEAFRDSLNKIRHYDIGLVYYSGHGIEVDHKNYIIPLEATLKKRCYVTKTCISVDELLEAMPVPLKIIILDACRDNTFEQNVGHPKLPNEGGNVGRVKISSPKEGTLLVYGTSSGKTADDAPTAKNGAYTGCVKDCLKETVIAFPDVFECASSKMGNNQKPETNSHSFGQWYLRW